MGSIASQITSLPFVYSAVYSGGDQRKHQISASLAFVRGFHGWSVISPQKWSIMRKCFHLMTSSSVLCVHLSAFEYAGEGESQRETGRGESIGIKMFGMLHRLGGWIWEGKIYPVFVLWLVCIWFSENLISNSHGFSVIVLRVSLLASGYLCAQRSNPGVAMNRPSTSHSRNIKICVFCVHNCLDAM